METKYASIDNIYYLAFREKWFGQQLLKSELPMLKEVVNLGGISMKTKTFNSKICIQLMMNTQKNPETRNIYTKLKQEKSRILVTVYFFTGKGNRTRIIDIIKVSSALGTRHFL